MAIPDKALRLLFQKSGNRCAFEQCRELLTAPASGAEGTVVLGHVAHIVGHSRRGPRGEAELDPKMRESYENLILFCTRHHKLVDSLPETYTALVLQAMKDGHERWVEETLGRSGEPLKPPRTMVSERLHSNLMRVERLPTFVYSAPFDRTDADVVQGTNWPAAPLMSPWTRSGGRLFAFQDLRKPDNPFASLVDSSSVEQHRLADWFDDPDQTNSFLAMGNRTMISLARRRGLLYDREHKRAFFAPKEVGKERFVTYHSMTKRTSRKRVVYQPKSKKYGTALGFWVHWALRLRLIQVAVDEFVISFTPDLRVTRDGQNELPPEVIGEKVTRRKGRWYNFETLSHVQFWRYYLSEGRPRIVLPFANGSAMVINTTLIQATVTWPGIPPEFAKTFTNIDYEADLFSELEERMLGQTNEGQDDEGEEDTGDKADE